MEEESPSSINYFNIINSYLVQIRENVSNNISSIGWTLLIAFIVLYNLWPYIEQLRSKVCVNVANDPSRKKLFNEELKRARAMQQLDVYKANRKNRESVPETTKEDDIEDGKAPEENENTKFNS